MKTIDQYLRDLTAYDVTDGAVGNALINAGVDSGADVASLTDRERELCCAWIYMWCASTPSATASRKDSDNGWSHEEGGVQTSAYDKRLLRRMAADIFRKWGVDAGEGSTVRLSSVGMAMAGRARHGRRR